MHWEPLDSPYTHAKKAVYKLLVKVRAAVILLYSSWYMKPSHFRPGVDSIYKNLGWGLPFLPGFLYAWSAQAFFGPSMEQMGHALPQSNYLFNHFLYFFWIGNYILIPMIIYFGAFIVFGSHWVFCGLGRICGMRESPPPYEFFLVRTAGGFMWFSIAIGLMALPVLAQRPDLIGRLAANAFVVPLIWAVLFSIAGLSSMGAGNKGKVGLKEMYKSERFVKFVWRTQGTLAVLTFAGIIFLGRHPDLLSNLILSHH